MFVVARLGLGDVVGSAAAPAGVELENRRRPVARADRRMGHELAEAAGEAFVRGIVETHRRPSRSQGLQRPE